MGHNLSFSFYISLQIFQYAEFFNEFLKFCLDWLEFSPYEIGIAKYAAFMKTEHFGSKLFKGRIVKKFPEYPLHFLQGL